MSMFRIALANMRFPATREESVTLAEQAIAEGSIERAGVICFPECFIPGYRRPGKPLLPPDPAFLERAWSTIAAAAANANIAVVLGTERIVNDALLLPRWSLIPTERAPVFRTKFSLIPPRKVFIGPAPGGEFFKPVR